MTEHDGPEPDPTPDAAPDPVADLGADARVRALLAGVGSGEDTEASRLPPDVAARLEETLAALVAERGAERLAEEHRATGSVVPLRPSWMPRLAAAAAAVVVLGAGGLVLSSWNQDRGASSDAGGSTSSHSQAGSALPSAQGTPEPSGSGGGTARDLGQAPDQRQMADPSRALPQLHQATFEADARALLRRRPTLRTPPTTTPAPGTTDLYRGCPGPTTGPGTEDGAAVTPVRYDGRTVALVVRAADADGQLVEAWTCDGERRLASVTLTP